MHVAMLELVATSQKHASRHGVVSQNMCSQPRSSFPWVFKHWSSSDFRCTVFHRHHYYYGASGDPTLTNPYVSYPYGAPAMQPQPEQYVFVWCAIR